jgi:alanine dehydrogenase
MVSVRSLAPPAGEDRTFLSSDPTHRSVPLLGVPLDTFLVRTRLVPSAATRERGHPVIVGVPRERMEDEYRVAITPAGVRELTSAGHTVYVERGAGIGSSIPDDDFSRTGADVLADPDDVWGQADLVLKVKEPVPEEYDRLRLRNGQVLFTYLHLAASRACTEALMAGGNTAIAYETVQLPDGSLPLLTPMSEVAGRMAPIVGAHHLMRPGGGGGVLVCGIPGVRSAKVVILGAGIAGMAAATLAVGLHCQVYILDRNLERLRQVDHHFRGALETVASSTHAIDETCLDADIVIGAVLVVGALAPKLVTDELVAHMRPGSVLVDISVDQGGCFESTRPTTHSHPTFVVGNSLFYCVSNMPGAVPHSSTHALVNATLPYTLEIAELGWRKAAWTDTALARGVNVVEGQVTYEPVAEAHGLPFAPLTSVIGPMP